MNPPRRNGDCPGIRTKLWSRILNGASHRLFGRVLTPDSSTLEQPLRKESSAVNEKEISNEAMLWIVSTSHAQWIRILGQSPLAGEDMSPEVPTQINQSFALQDPSALPLDLRDRPMAGSTHATSNVSPASYVQSKESVLGGRRAFLRLRFSECPLLLPYSFSLTPSRLSP